MKKCILLVFALLSAQVIASAASGEEGSSPFDVRLGWGAMPSKFETYFQQNNNALWNYQLTNIYKDYRGTATSTNAISAEFMYRISERTSVSLVAAFNLCWYDRYSAETKEKIGKGTSYAIYIVPTFRLYYLNKPMVRLYGTVGAGVGKYIGFDSLKYIRHDSDGAERIVDGALKFEGTFSPFGIEVGKKLYGFLELGVSTMYTGLNAGIGYKF